MEPIDRSTEHTYPPRPEPDDALLMERAVAVTPSGSDAVLRRDRVRWGPIMAGLLTAITTLLVLTVLGLAIGLSAFEPNETGARTAGASAAIWGAVSALLAFFVGGWIAARSAAVSGEGSGLLNGLMVGVTGIALTLLLVGVGLGNLLGAAGTNIGEIADIGRNATNGDPAGTARAAYDEARNSAWGTLAGLLLALGAAGLGGWIGHNDRGEVLQTAGPAGRRTRNIA